MDWLSACAKFVLADSNNQRLKSAAPELQFVLQQVTYGEQIQQPQNLKIFPLLNFKESVFAGKPRCSLRGMSSVQKMFPRAAAGRSVL